MSTVFKQLLPRWPSDAYETVVGEEMCFQMFLCLLFRKVEMEGR